MFVADENEPIKRKTLTVQEKKNNSRYKEEAMSRLAMEVSYRFLYVRYTSQ